MAVFFKFTCDEAAFLAALPKLLAKPCTPDKVREGLLAFLPARLHSAVIDQHRKVTAMPAHVVLLKLAKHLATVDLLVPDLPPEASDPDSLTAEESDDTDTSSQAFCEDCGQFADAADHKWCQRCWLRSYFPYPNKRDPLS